MGKTVNCSNCRNDCKAEEVCDFYEEAVFEGAQVYDVRFDNNYIDTIQRMMEQHFTNGEVIVPHSPSVFEAMTVGTPVVVTSDDPDAPHRRAYEQELDRRARRIFEENMRNAGLHRDEARSGFADHTDSMVITDEAIEDGVITLTEPIALGDGIETAVVQMRDGVIQFAEEDDSDLAPEVRHGLDSEEQRRLVRRYRDRRNWTWVDTIVDMADRLDAGMLLEIVQPFQFMGIRGIGDALFNIRHHHGHEPDGIMMHPQDYAIILRDSVGDSRLRSVGRRGGHSAIMWYHTEIVSHPRVPEGQMWVVPRRPPHPQNFYIDNMNMGWGVSNDRA